MTLPDNIKEEIEKEAQKVSEMVKNPEAAAWNNGLYNGYIQGATKFYERGKMSDETAKYWWDNYPRGIQGILTPTQIVSANEYSRREEEARMQELKAERRRAIEYAVSRIWEDEGFTSGQQNWNSKVHADELFNDYEKSLEGGK